MGRGNVNCLRKGQSELIAGVLVLAVLFTAVIPLMLRIQTASVNLQTTVADKVKFLQLRNEETLSVMGVPETPENLRAGLFPGVWINNTGGVPVTIDTLLLINRDTGRIDYMVDLSRIGYPWPTNSVVEWAMMDLGTENSRPLMKGTYPTLNPGETLLIKLNLTGTAASKYYFRIITSTGTSFPKNQEAYLNPTISTYGGGSNVWRGLYYPTSGYKLIGYDQITKSSSLTLMEGNNSLDAETSYLNSFIWDDWSSAGLYKITLNPETYGGILKINGIDYSTYLDSENYLVFTGFLGTYEFAQSSTSYWGSTEENFIKGYFANMYVCDVSTYNPFANTSLSTCTLIKKGFVKTLSNSSTGFIRKEDLDHNGIPEIALDTIGNNNFNSENSLALRILVPKDITHADYIKVSVKITYYWALQHYGFVNLNLIRKLRVAMVSLYRFDESNGEWVFSTYRDLIFSTAKPKTFLFSATFPVNRSGIYRVAVFLFDPYTEVVDPDDPSNYGFLQFRVGLEYLLVEWGVNNPYLRSIPSIYLLAMPSYTSGGLGEGNETENMEKLLNIVESKLQSVGINSYIVVDTPQLLNDILLSSPPKDAIVINLHGNLTPIYRKTVLDLVNNYGWIWVNIVGPPPVPPPNVGLDDKTGVNADAGPSWNDMVKAFSLYNLRDSIWSNRTVINSSLNPPTYVFYQNATAGRIVCGAWQYGKGFIVVNDLPPLDWNGTDPHGTQPDFDASLAVFEPLYIWLATKS